MVCGRAALLLLLPPPLPRPGRTRAPGRLGLLSAAKAAKWADQEGFEPCILYMDSLGASKREADAVAAQLRTCAAAAAAAGGGAARASAAARRVLTRGVRCAQVLHVRVEPPARGGGGGRVQR